MPRRGFQFGVLAYLTGRHWTLSRHVWAVLGAGLTLGLTGRMALARDTHHWVLTDDYKTAAHRLDWYAHYGWTGRFLRRRPAYDISEHMPHDGLAALESLLGQRATPAQARARLYVLARRARHTIGAQRAGYLARYVTLARQITSALPPPAADAPKAAPAFTAPQAAEALADTAELLTGLGLPWYIVSGTLLGAVREGDFLTHDYDIDVGVHAEAFDPVRFRHAVQAARDLCLERIDDYVDMTGDPLTPVQTPALYKVRHRSGVEIDVFLHYLEGGQRWHGSARHRWWNTDFTIATAKIGAQVVPAPADADTYLAENYGDWRTPRTDFDSSTGTPNVSFNRNLASVAQFLTQAAQGSATAQQVLTQEGYLQDGQFNLPWAAPKGG